MRLIIYDHLLDGWLVKEPDKQNVSGRLCYTKYIFFFLNFYFEMTL